MSNIPVPLAFTVSHERVARYADVVEFMVTTAVNKYIVKNNKHPTQSQVEFLRRQLIRKAVIGHDLDAANKLEITESSILNEHANNPLPARF